MSKLNNHHFYDIFYYCEYSVIKKLPLINKRITSLFQQSPFVFNHHLTSLTPQARRIEGDFCDIFSLNYTKESELTIKIGSFSYWKKKIETIQQFDEDGYCYDEDDENDNFIHPDFDEMMFQSIKSKRSQIQSLKIYCPTKCLTTFKQFTALEKLILPYDILLSTFNTLKQKRPPMYLQKIPISYCCLIDVPFPLPEEVLIFFSILDHYCKKVVIPSQLEYNEKVLESMGKYSPIIFYIHQFIHPQFLNSLPSNVILERSIVNDISIAFAGYNNDFNSFTKTYFPFSVLAKHISSIWITQHLNLYGNFCPIIEKEHLLSLTFKEDKSKNQLMYDFTEFTSLTSLSLSAENIVQRMVLLPGKLKELSLDCFIVSLENCTELPTTLTSLSLRQLSDTNLHLPQSVQKLDLRWFNKCTCIDNLHELTQLTECDIRGFTVNHLSFPYSLLKLSLHSCPQLESLIDYDFLFDLNPTVQNCPKIFFN